MKQTFKESFDSIIFDLDGTLWDSTVNVADAWTAARDEVDYVDIDITPKNHAKRGVNEPE